MARWEPGTPQRLQQAALELFATHGFEQTTASDIARAAGVTERTFFRHFADKREVLFFGQEQFERAFLDGLEATSPGAEPLQLVTAALTSAAAFFPDERRAWARSRQHLLEGHPALLERESHKLAVLATTVSTALRERGIAPLPATLAAQSCLTVFVAAFAQWVAPGETRSMAELVTAVLGELQAVTGGGR